MGVWTQLRLLLYKNFLLRARQPVILGLEILWPIAIVLVVLGMRLTIPPVQQDTCYYNARALPSAGGLAFMQSLICNIDNDCLDNQTYEEIPSYKNARVDELVSQVSPLMTDGEIIQLVRALPKGVNLMRAVIDTLSMPQVQEILDKGLPVGKLLKDPDKIRDILQNEVKINSPGVAESLSKANVSIHKPKAAELPTIMFLYRVEKLVQESDVIVTPDDVVVTSLLLQLMTSPVGLSETVCKPETLKQYLLVPDKRSLQEVANALCALDTKAISKLMDRMQKEIDTGKVIKMVSDLMTQFGRPDVGVMLEDIGTMMSTFFNLPSVISAAQESEKKSSSGFARWLPRLKSIVEPLKNGDINLALIGEVAHDIEPLLDGDKNGPKVKKVLKYVSMIARLIKQGLKSLPEPNPSLGAIIKNSDELASHLQSTFSPATVKALLKAKLKPGMEIHMKDAGTPTKVFQVFCESPGLSTMFALPGPVKPKAWNELQTFQDALCVLHLNGTSFEIEQQQDAEETEEMENQSALLNNTSDILDTVDNLDDNISFFEPKVFVLGQQLIDSVLDMLSSRSYNGTKVGQVMNAVTGIIGSTKLWPKVGYTFSVMYHFLNVTLDAAFAEMNVSQQEGVDVFFPYLVESLLITIGEGDRWKYVMDIDMWPSIACDPNKFAKYFVVPSVVRGETLQEFTCKFLGNSQSQIRDAILYNRTKVADLKWEPIMEKAGAFVNQVKEKHRNRNFVSSYNWTRLDEALEIFIKVVWKDVDYRNRTAVVVKGFKQVGDWLERAKFRYAKDYKALIYSLHRIITMIDSQLSQMIATNSIQAKHLSFGLMLITKVLQDIAQELPDAFRISVKVLSDPTELFDKVGNSPDRLDKVPCQKGSITNFLPVRNKTHLIAIEKYVCRFYKQMPQVVLQDVYVGEILAAIHNASTGAPLRFSWDEVEASLISLQENFRTLESFNGTLFPDVPTFNRTDFDLALEDFKYAWPSIRQKYSQRRFLVEILDSVVQLVSNTSTDRQPTLASLKWQNVKGQILFENVVMSAKFAVWAGNEFMEELLNYVVKLKNNKLGMDDLLNTSVLRDLWQLLMNFPYVSEVAVRSLLNPAFADVLEDFIEEKESRTICSSYSSFVQLVQFDGEMRALGETAYIVLCQLNKESWQEVAQQIWRGSAFSALIERVSQYWYSKSPTSIPVRVLSFFDKVSNMVELVRDMVEYPPIFRWGGEDTLLKASVWEKFGTSTYNLMKKASKQRFTIAVQPVVTLLENLSKKSKYDMTEEFAKGAEFLSRLLRALEKVRDNQNTTLEMVAKHDPVVSGIMKWSETYLVDGIDALLYTFAIDSRKLSPFFSLERSVRDLVCNDSFTMHFMLPSHIMNRKSIQEGLLQFCSNSWFPGITNTSMAPDKYKTRMRPRNFMSSLGQTLDFLVNTVEQDPGFIVRTSPLLMASTWSQLLDRFYKYYDLPTTDEKSWIKPTAGRLMDAFGSNKFMAEFFNDVFALTSCTMNKVKGGLRWTYFELEQDDRKNLLNVVKVLNDSAEIVQSSLNTLRDLDKLQIVIQDFMLSNGKRTNFCTTREWNKYFVISNELESAAFHQLQTLLCRTNYTAAMIELNPAVYCTFAHEEVRPSVVSRTDLESSLKTFYENASATLTMDTKNYVKSQKLARFDLPWRNSTRWLNIFRTFSEDIDASVRNFTIDSFPDWIKVVGVMYEDLPESWAAFNFFHDFVNNFVKNVEFFNDSSTAISFERMLTKTPYLREVLQSWLQRLPEITETTMWSLMAPRKILPLLTTRRNNVKASVCRTSVKRYLYNPRLDEEQWGMLQDLFCNVSYSQLYSDLKIITPINSQMLTQRDSKRPVNWSGLSQDVEQLMKILERLVVTRPVFGQLTGKQWRSTMDQLRAHFPESNQLSGSLSVPLFLALNGLVNGVSSSLNMARNCSVEDRLTTNYDVPRDLSETICTSGWRESSVEVFEAVKLVTDIVEDTDHMDDDFRFKEFYQAAQKITRIKVLIRSVAGDPLVRNWEKQQQEYWQYLQDMSNIGISPGTDFDSILQVLPKTFKSFGNTYLKNVSGIDTVLRGFSTILEEMINSEQDMNRTASEASDVSGDDKTNSKWMVKSLLRNSQNIATTLVWTSRMPLGLLKVLLRSGSRGSQMLELMCNGSLSDTLSNPSLGLRDWSKMQAALCMHNHTAIWKEVNAIVKNEQENPKDKMPTDPISDFIQVFMDAIAHLSQKESSVSLTTNNDLQVDKQSWRDGFSNLARISAQPEVIIYTIHQNVFSQFCLPSGAEFRLPDYSDRIALQHTLCEMSSKDFATRVGLGVRKLAMRMETQWRRGRQVTWSDVYETMLNTVGYKDIVKALLRPEHFLRLLNRERNFIELVTYDSIERNISLHRFLMDRELSLQETSDGQQIVEYYYFIHTFLKPTVRKRLNGNSGNRLSFRSLLKNTLEVSYLINRAFFREDTFINALMDLPLNKDKVLEFIFEDPVSTFCSEPLENWTNLGDSVDQISLSDLQELLCSTKGKSLLLKLSERININKIMGEDSRRRTPEQGMATSWSDILSSYRQMQKISARVAQEIQTGEMHLVDTYKLQIFVNRVLKSSKVLNAYKVSDVMVNGVRFMDKLLRNSPEWQTGVGFTRAILDATNYFLLSDTNEDIYGILSNGSNLGETIKRILESQSGSLTSLSSHQVIHAIKIMGRYYASKRDVLKESCRVLDTTKDNAVVRKLLEIFCGTGSPRSWFPDIKKAFLTDSSGSYIRHALNALAKLVFASSREVQAEIKDWLHGSNMEDLEPLFRSIVGKFVKAPGGFYELEGRFLRPIPLAIWEALPIMLRAQGDLLCLHTNVTTYLILSSSLAQGYVSKIPDPETIFCELPSWTVTQVYRWISRNFEVRRLAHITHQLLSKNPRRPTYCATPLGVVADILEYSNRLWRTIGDNTRSNRLQDCMNSFFNTTLLKNMNKYGDFVRNVSAVVQESENGTGVESSSGSKDQNTFGNLWKRFSEIVAAQLPAYQSFGTFLRKSFYLKKTLLAPPFNFTEDVLETLFNSSINLNWMARMNFSQSTIESAVCSRTNLRPMFHLTLGSIKTSALHHLLCKKNALTTVLQAFDTQRIVKELPRLQRAELLKGDWLEYLVKNIQVIVKHFLDLTSVGSRLLNRFSSGVTSELLTNIVQVLRENTVDQLLVSLQGLLEKVEPAIEGGRVSDDIKMVLQGLRSLKSLQKLNLFNIRYRLSDLFSEPAKVAEFLRDELDLHESAVDDVMGAQLDLSQVLGTRNLVESVQEVMCNPEELKQLLRLNSNEVTAENMTNTLCSLSTTQTLTISSKLLSQVAFSKIIENFVEVGINGVLGKVNLTWNEAVGAVNALKTAPVVMPKLRKYMKVVTSALDQDIQEDLSKLNISTEGIRFLGSPTALKAFGKLLCGKKLKALAQEFELLKVSNKEPTLDTREIDDLPSEFCRTGYKQVMRMVGGPVLWGFLKPVLRGKILFAPKNAVSQAVFTEVNKTFEVFAGFVENLQSWGQGIAGLNYLKTRKDTLDKMKELLRSDSVQPIMRQVVGSDATNMLDEFDISNLGNQLGNVSGLLDLMQLVGNMSQCFELNRFHGFDTEMELELTAQRLSLKREFIAAVVFVESTDLRPSHYRFRRKADEDLETVPEIIPKHIKYKLRMDIDNVPTTRTNRLQFWRPGPRDDFIDDLRYFRGFVQYQEMIDKAIISIQTKGQPPPVLPATFLQQFPYPCYQKDNFGVFLKAMLPVIMLVCWLFLVAFLIREFVLEKELHLEELLCVMGLRPWIAWLAWFIAGLVMLSTGVAFSTIILKLGGIFPYANGLILFIFLMEYAVVVIMYCYLISCIFKTATIAALTGVILYLITFLPFVLIVSLEAQLEHWQKLLSSTLLSSGFCYGCLHIIRYEDRGIGISWENIWYSAVPNDPMTFVWSLTMLAVDSILYGILGWYIANVWPSNSGRKQPWYFFMSPDYWGFKKKRRSLYFQSPKLISGSLGHFFGEDVKSHVEEAPVGETCGISLRGLGVIYNKGKPLERVAVSGLTMDFMEGHITTLLGQNGAGKTTTINVLTGQIPPTSGTVFVCEKLIPDEFSEVQKYLGYCPQYNTLFARMSVREHLRFYGELKGILHGKQLDEDVDEMLHSMGLWYMQNEQARFLSGGMQRRLCVALAFIGGSKVIILDEPTSSVDPVARRNIWDLIVKYRQGRTILLTTHHMDEADILSDKVAIIHRGKLLCHGSPLLLKSKFGCGYQLTLVRHNTDVDQDSDSGRASSSCSEESSTDQEDILSFVQNHVSLARLMEDNGTEMVLSLPQRNAEGHLYSFADLFRKLDENHSTLGFSSFGISSTTLEEVFLTLCGLDDNTALPVAHSEPLPMRKNSIVKSHDEKQFNSLNEKNGLLSDIGPGGGNATWTGSPLDFGCTTPNKGFRLKAQQLQALLLKRYYHLLRDWKSICSGILLPCAFIAFAMGFSLIRPSGWGTKEPALLLSPPMYGPGLKNFYHYAGPENSGLSLIRDGILEEPGISTACLKDATQEARRWCNRDNMTLVTDQEILTAGGLCSGPEEEFRLQLSLPKYNKIKSWPTNTGDMMENLTGFNVNDYLLDTYVPNIERRYGGWTFLQDDKEHDIVKVWYDNTGFHATPAYLNSLSNWILKANVKSLGMDSVDYGITVYNHPLQVTSEQLGRATLLNRASELGIALVVFMGFAFIPSSFIVYVVRERIQEEKRLQFVGGVGPLLYWTSALLWDLILILIAVLISLVIILIFSLPMYVSKLNLPGVIVLLILFGFSTTPLMYLLEKLFVEPSIAFMVLYCVNIFIGISIMVGQLILGLFSFDTGTRYWLDLMQHLALVFPQYCLIGGLVEMAKNQIQTDVFAMFGQDTYESPFSINVVLPHMMAMSIEGVLFFVLTLLLEVKWHSRIPNCRMKSLSSAGETEDGDVADERRRVQSVESRDDVLKVTSMRKVFHGMAGRNVAVDNVSFGIPKGECFGLLGVNGAGKTTLFRILTGQIEPSGGNAYVAGLKVADILSKNNEVLGYCPQADALDDLLTPEQHLKIYGNLRGIPKKELKEIIHKAMARFELKLYTNRKVGTLSRGTKRKVCTAVSMLGNPQIILLDEPTTGMDPVTRRLVWNNIIQTIRDQRSVLLTSHSMEECDVLCSRLAIMVNGRIKCLGSPQYLKFKFGVGYTISLRLGSTSDLDRVMDFMARFFTTAILRAHHYNMIEFSLPEKNIPLSDIFKHLEQNRQKLGIKDFSISQTTLDQVFVSFARQQSDGIAESFNQKKEQYAVSRENSIVTEPRGAYNPAFLPDTDQQDSCAIKLENLSNASLEEKQELQDAVAVTLQEEDCEATRF